MLLQEVEFHFDKASRQRASYAKDLTDIKLLKTSLVIEIDFKAVIVLGIDKNFI